MITGNANNNFEETYTIIYFIMSSLGSLYGIDVDLGSVQVRFCQQLLEAWEISQCTFPGKGH